MLSVCLGKGATSIARLVANVGGSKRALPQWVFYFGQKRRKWKLNVAAAAMLHYSNQRAVESKTTNRVTQSTGLQGSICSEE